MLNKKTYTNGQKVYELIDDILSYFYKNGQLKARGKYVNEQMEGQWQFYRENGQLWQIGNFLNNKKHGHWLRYDRSENQEYSAYFNDNKLIKQEK